MGKKTSGKVLVVVALLAWVFVVRFLTACSVEKEELEKVRDLEFTVVGETDLPEELKNVIEEKKMGPFKLTYTDAQNLYIVVGYGEQYFRKKTLPDGKCDCNRYRTSGTAEGRNNRGGKIVSLCRHKNRVSGTARHFSVTLVFPRHHMIEWDS